MSQNNRKTDFKRRNFYIDKEFQNKFIVNFSLVVLMGSLVTVGVVYWLARHSTTVAIINGRVGVHTTAEYLLPLLVQTFLIELVVVSVATIAMTVLISHKIAGPLYRLKVMLSGLGEGDVSTPMRLRDGDQLQQVAQSYNEAINKLNYKIKMLKNAPTFDDLKRDLDKFKIS